MNLKEYQPLARRTQNPNLSIEDRQRHALFGMIAELAEIFENVKRREDVIDELSDFMWFAAEYCDTIFVTLADLVADDFRFPAPTRDVESEMQAIEHGMVCALGSLYSLHQKTYQGHDMNKDLAKSFVCTLTVYAQNVAQLYGVTLSDVMQHNVDKLKKRYPAGFDPERSLHRTN